MIDNVNVMLLLSQLGLRMAELGNTQSNKVYLKLHLGKENKLNCLTHKIFIIARPRLAISNTPYSGSVCDARCSSLVCYVKNMRVGAIMVTLVCTCTVLGR